MKSCAADGVAGADRRGLRAQSDHPAQARSSRRSNCPTTGRWSSRWTSRSGPIFRSPSTSGLKVKRPVKTIREQDVEAQLERFLERHAQIVPKLEGAARIGDYLTADLTFLKPDGGVLNEVKEIQFRLQPELRFQDGHIPGIGSALEGVKPGEVREVRGQARLRRCRSIAPRRDGRP